MLTIPYFLAKFTTENESNTKLERRERLQQLQIPTRVYTRDGKLRLNSGFLKLNPTKRTRSVNFRDFFIFDFDGRPPPHLVHTQTKSQHRKPAFLEYQSKKKNSLYASCWLYVLYVYTLL